MGEAYLWNELGLLYYRLGLFDEAIRLFGKAIELAPNIPVFYCNLADAYFEKREFGQALALYKRSLFLLQTPSEQASVWNRIGNAYRALKDLDSAIAAFRKAEELEMQTCHLASANSDFFQQVQKSQAVMLSSADMHEVASPAPAQATQTISANSENSSREAVKNGQSSEGNEPAGENAEELADTAPGQARKAGSSLDAITPKEPAGRRPVHSNSALEELLARVKTYEQITAAQPTNHAAWDTLGKLYKSLERYQDAIRAYHEAIKNDPKNENYYYYLGLLYSIEQQPENAILAFERVLALRPDHTLAHSALAGLYRRKGMESRANFHLSAAMGKIHRESAYNRACFYAICEELDLALQYLRQALETGETSVRWVKLDPDLEPLRSDKRYQQLLQQFEAASANEQDKNYFSSNVQGNLNQTLPFYNQVLSR